MSDELKRCDWTRERIEPYLDGDVRDAERAAFESHCTSCAACARELSLAIRIRRELRSLPVFEAPPRVVEQSAREIAAARTNVIALPARPMRPVRRALPAVAAALLIAAAGLWFTDGRRETAEYSEAEIQKARAGMALAFGYVDRYSDGVVRTDVLEKRVVPRIERAMRGDDGDVTSRAPERS